MKYKIAFSEIVKSLVEVEADSEEGAIQAVLSGEFDNERVVERETYGDPEVLCKLSWQIKQ